MDEWLITCVEGHEACLAALDYDPSEVVATPFQDREWLLAWATAFAARPEARVFVITVSDAAGRPVLRLPLSLETFSGVRILRGWDRSVSDYNGPILTRGVAFDDAAAATIWKAIRRVLPAADLLVFDKQPERIDDVANPLVRIAPVTRSMNTAHISPLGPSGVAVDPTLGRSLARKRHKLRNKGELVFDRSLAADRTAAFEQLLLWRRDRFAEANRGRDVAAVEAFWRRLNERRSIARLATLVLEGRLLAAAYGTRTGDSFQLLAVGFDPTWKNWSPGLVLIEDLVAAEAADGVRFFDFTIGDAGYKKLFAAEGRPLFDLFVPFTLKGRLAAHWRRHQIRRRRAQADRAL